MLRRELGQPMRVGEQEEEISFALRRHPVLQRAEVIPKGASHPWLGHQTRTVCCSTSLLSASRGFPPIAACTVKRRSMVASVALQVPERT